MSFYTTDGGVIPSGVPISERVGAYGHYRLFGLFKGQIVRVVYPDDPQNTTGSRVEYQVRVKGQNFPVTTDLRNIGGIFDYSERIRKERRTSYSGKFDDATFDENFDGEMVYVMFLEGNGDLPIIIGSAEHPKHSAYKKRKKDDGSYSIEEFNGVEIFIDKDSNYCIQQVGRKDVKSINLANPTIENPISIGAFIKLYGNGQVEFRSSGGKIFKLSATKQILGAGSEKMILGDTQKSILNTFLTSLETDINPGSPGQNAASLLAIKAAATALKNVLSTMLSPNSVTD